MLANIGRPDGEGFGCAEVVADVDAFLVARDWYTTMSSALSESLRRVLQDRPAERIDQFYQLRFEKQPNNASRAFSRLVTGEGVLDPIPLRAIALRQAVGLRGGDPMPTAQEAGACGRTFAEKLATLSA
ncbi:hypothetical protein MF406_10135 [Georgenia sp. TF02-10]|uniref:hypothetical protein n=1 Tax=Georgenia sp. TF02-10 TaxID=2917725 RepID=UPI001FA7A784|nr:hypothetical protein [Georgenia sp. TF02-10]UNX53370.1 hypothetical protein MF406_10135 [Georgenia sp. TF02-10]